MKRLLLIFHVFMLSYLVILTIIKLTTIKTHRMQNMEEKAMKMNSPEIKHFIKKYDKGLIIFLFGIIIDQVIFLIVKKELAFIWVWGVLALTIVLVCIIGWQFAVRHYQGVEYVKGMGCKDEKLSEFSEEIAVARDEINKWNNKLDHLVAQRTSSITSLLDNVGQGLLYFSSDLIVKPEYSSVCREIFKGEISGRKISELIYPKDANNRRILEDALAIIINEKDSDRREVLFSLLPNEVEIKDNLIKIEYRDMEAPRYGTKSMMMILTDIKFNKLMENRMEQERNILKMVVNIVVNYDEFTECREDYRNFCLFGVNEIIEKGASREVEYSEIFREIHNHKGNFSQFGMINIVNKLHELETQLERLRENKGEGPLYSLKKLVNVEELEEWLEEDLNIIENVLGKEFIKRTTRHAIDNQKIIEIENKMISLLSEHEYNILIPFIRRLRYKTVKELLRQYPDYIQNLAVHLNKQVNWVLVEGSDIELDSEKCHDFIKSLIHVFRNMVDHGIETINQRVAKGKEEFGSIKCRVNYQEEYIVISISDDGGGISIEDLKKNIMEKGLLDSEKVNSISKEELINYIFQEGFSTQKDISVISGRGVGLSFVKHEVERLGGFVKVNTEVDKGTEFLFFLPNVANLHYTDNA